MIWTEEQLNYFRKAHDEAESEVEREVYKRLAPEVFETPDKPTLLMAFLSLPLSYPLGRLTIVHRSYRNRFGIELWPLCKDDGWPHADKLVAEAIPGLPVEEYYGWWEQTFGEFSEFKGSLECHPF